MQDSDEHLHDDTTIVPNTLSPVGFSTQVSERLGIGSYLKRIADATSNINNHNTHAAATINIVRNPI